MIAQLINTLDCLLLIQLIFILVGCNFTPSRSKFFYTSSTCSNTEVQTIIKSHNLMLFLSFLSSQIIIINKNLFVEQLQFITGSEKETMSRYEQFYEDQEEHITEQAPISQEDLICIKNLIPKANALLDKVQLLPYQPNNYYPGPLLKLPQGLGCHHYDADRNNMNLIDESLFNHIKLKQDVVRCLQSRHHANNSCSAELSTLREYYANKHLIYERYMPSFEDNQHFGTFILKLSQLGKQKTEGKSVSVHQVHHSRKSKTPILLSERSCTERLGLHCRSIIEFNSNFQCGNLFRAYQREHNQFDLLLQNDINTKGNNQWFFFSVRNVAKGATIKINLVNMAKKHSLFQTGMRPSVFSMVRFEKRGVGWVRQGTKVRYEQSNQLKKENGEAYHRLSFEYKFIYEGDIVYFSYAIPYGYSNLTKFLSNALESQSSRVKFKTIATTLGGNDVNLLQISSPEVISGKKVIWVLGRQHPGETTGSFMMEGVIDYLLSEREEACFLRNNYIIKIIPMMNIDGVVHGNSRAQLIGCDSNRQWADPHPYYHPLVHSLRKMIEKDSPQLVLDLHSHSRKLGTFFYANHSQSTHHLIRLLPFLVCSKDERFDYRSCRYNGGSNLSARKVLFDLLKTPFVYTVQSSFYGYQKEGEYNITPYQPEDYRQMGQTILTAFTQIAKKRSNHKSQNIFSPKELLLGNQQLWDKLQEEDQVESLGSDQDPGADEFSKQELEAILPRQPKKSTRHKKKRVTAKPQQIKKPVKKEELQNVKTKKMDNQSCFKKLFSGRCSLNLKRTDIQYPKKPPVQTRSIGTQAELAEKSILNRSTNINLPQKDKEKKGLWVVGQKMQQQLTISANSIGVQVQMTRSFLKSRNEIALSNQSLTKRGFKMTPRVGTILLHNQNNFLNRGDILHSAIRMLNKK